jgi:hypothetical protein
VIQPRSLLCLFGIGALIACSGSGASVVDTGNQAPAPNVEQPPASNQDPPANAQRPPASTQDPPSSGGSSSSVPVVSGNGQAGAGNPGPPGPPGTGGGGGKTCDSDGDACAGCMGICDLCRCEGGTAMDCASVCP